VLLAKVTDERPNSAAHVVPNVLDPVRQPKSASRSALSVVLPLQNTRWISAGIAAEALLAHARANAVAATRTIWGDRMVMRILINDGKK
jgi:hypothetical protein